MAVFAKDPTSQLISAVESTAARALSSDAAAPTRVVDLQEARHLSHFAPVLVLAHPRWRSRNNGLKGPGTCRREPQEVQVSPALEQTVRAAQNEEQRRGLFIWLYPGELLVDRSEAQGGVADSYGARVPNFEILCPESSQGDFMRRTAQ
jgi:hypothetical protein